MTEKEKEDMKPRQGTRLRTKTKNGEQRIIKDKDGEKEREKVYPVSAFEKVFRAQFTLLPSRFRSQFTRVPKLSENLLIIYVDPRD